MSTQATRIRLLTNALEAIRDAKPSDAHYDARAAVIYYQNQARIALERVNALPAEGFEPMQVPGLWSA